MFFKLCVLFCVWTAVQVTAKTPNIISYTDVLLGAHVTHAKQAHQQQFKSLYKELFRLIWESQLTDRLKESTDNDDLAISHLLQEENTNQNFEETPRVDPPSQLCLNHSQLIIAEVQAGTSWAMSFVDAAAKPESDIKGGQTNWVGSYGECIETTAYREMINGTGEGYLFHGQYCTVVLQQYPGPLTPVTPGAVPIGIRVGLCVPSTCGGDDVTSIVTSLIGAANISLYVGGTICQEKMTYDSRAITVLFIISLFLAAMLAGTVYDIVCVQRPKWKHVAAKRDVESRPQNSTVNIKDHSQSYENTPLVPAEKPPPIVEDTGVVAQFLMAFSVYSNAQKIFSTRHVTGSITCIHGIRFISMTWIILGHTIAFGESASVNVIRYTERALKDWTFQAIANAEVAVDTFFTISGLLVTYLILKELSKNKGKINWFMFYFHRYWRLTPIYMLVILVYVNLFRYWGQGPFWPQDGIEPDHCNNWWTNLLYVNNLVRPKQMCMSWSWYLANDMQFYVLSPLIFLPFFFSRIAGAVSSLVFLLASTITIGVLSKTKELPASLVGDDQLKMYDYFLDYYIKPYCRMGPYIIGMVAGNLLFQTQCKLRIPRVLNVIGWVTATGVSLAVLYGLYDNANGEPLSVDAAALYNAVHKTAWGMCVSWVVVACATGNGGVVNTMLSLPTIVPLSRLTYACYLVHPVVMCVYYFGREQLFVLSTIDVIWAFFGHLIATYLVALPTSLAFEAPMMGLEKAFIRKQK